MPEAYRPKGALKRRLLSRCEGSVSLAREGFRLYVMRPVYSSLLSIPFRRKSRRSPKLGLYR